MFDSLKQKLTPSKTVKKILKWIFIAIALLVLVWGVRSCTKGAKERSDTLRIGRDSSWYPVQLFGREKNLVAFTNDLFSLIGTENKLHFQWIEANPNTLNEGLSNGLYDFILSTMRPNIVNEERFSFSELIFEFGPVLIVRQSSQASTLEDMKGKTIGILSGFSTVFNAVRTPGANNFDLLLVTYDSIERALDALVHDQIDGVIILALPAYSATQGLYAGKLKVVTPPFNDEGLRLISEKNSGLDDILNLIDASLQKMFANGTYSSLIAKWDLVDPDENYWHPPQGEKK